MWLPMSPALQTLIDLHFFVRRHGDFGDLKWLKWNATPSAAASPGRR